MCLPPIPCHIIIFLISFFHHSTLRFNLYLHWVILGCKCISPGYYWKFPWTYVSFRGNSHCLALYFHLFYHVFLGGMFGLHLYKQISSSWFRQGYSSQSKLVCVDVACGWIVSNCQYCSIVMNFIHIYCVIGENVFSRLKSLWEGPIHKLFYQRTNNRFYSKML